MPPWIASALDVLQVIVNVGALVGGAVIWKLYVDKLQATLTSKDAEISSVEKNRDMWKDKAEELEKQSPAVMERLLDERIQIRESEIVRLTDDKGRHEEALKVLERERANLETDRARTRGFRLMLALEEQEPEDDGDPASLAPTPSPLSSEDQIEVVLLGEVGVDSGQLMITDPCYIDQEWRQPGDHHRAGLPESVGGQLNPEEVAPSNADTKMLAPYSYRGAMQASLAGGYGEMAFTLGHAGAGVVFQTAWGDGYYPIYGELHDGRIVRAYINVG